MGGVALASFSTIQFGVSFKNYGQSSPNLSLTQIPSSSKNGSAASCAHSNPGRAGRERKDGTPKFAIKITTEGNNQYTTQNKTYVNNYWKRG